ncbi:MAG: FAD-binding protein [Candidatus Babeliales bacterium]
MIIYMLFFFLFPMLAADEWTNWAGNLTCNPQQIIKPRNLEHLKEIIKKAAVEKKTIRAIGTGHSWTDILCTDGYLLNTDHLNRVLVIDKEKKQIRVQAGIKLKDLIKVLANNGLALPNQPAITEQSIAGVVSTATHGSGNTGTMADFVIKIELLAADGSIYEVSKTSHAEWFSACRMTIGSLGIIYAVTLQCVPLFWVSHIHYTTDWKIISHEYPNLHKNNDFFSFFLYADSNEVAVDIFNKTEKSRTTWFSKILNTDTQSKNIEYGYKVLSGQPSPLYLEEEIAVKQEILVPAVEAVQKLIKEYKKKGVSIDGILCRFVNAEKDMYLSPAAGRDVVFISVTTPVQEKFMPFYKEFYKTLLPFNGRPHWGKLNYLTYEDAFKLYGENLTKFIDVRKKLDLNGMFSNNFTKRVFGW